MLNGWLNTWNPIVVLACAGLLFTNTMEAQSQPQNQGPANQSQFGQSAQPAGQTYNPQLTPEQIAAQQRAAQQTPAQQQQAQREYAQQQYAQQLAAQKIVQPEGFPLPPEEENYVQQLLDAWQSKSKAVKVYRCQFQRYSYDPELVAWRDPASNRLAAALVTYGEIRFATPNKASYETNKIIKFSKPPQEPGGTAQYEEVKGDEVREQWMCDGKSIFEFDYQNKILYETKIPEGSLGNLAETELPFMFGTDKQEISNRYWVRYVTGGAPTEYWLELYPKQIKDARTYSKIEVIISADDWLPKAMHLYSPQYDRSQGNEVSQHYLFASRELNNQLGKFQNFFDSFVRPKVPAFGGWRRVDRNMEQNQAAAPRDLQMPTEQRR